MESNNKDSGRVERSSKKKKGSGPLFQQMKKKSPEAPREGVEVNGAAFGFKKGGGQSEPPRIEKGRGIVHSMERGGEKLDLVPREDGKKREEERSSS